ncbi:MAG: hypothetical protein QXQ84_04430 [Nitrososphaerota archaeon]
MSKRTRLFLIALIGFAESITHFGAITSADSIQYFNVTRFLLGIQINNWDPKLWVTRPLIPALATPLSLILGLPAAYGIINTIFVILSGILYYELAFKLTQSSRGSLIASIMLLTSFITISYGAASGKEAGGIFFQILVTLIVLSSPKGLMKAALTGLISGIGGLAYETVYVSVAFGFFLFLFRKNYREAFIYLLASLIPQIIPPIIGGYNIVERYLVASILYAKSINMYDVFSWFDLSNRVSQFIVAISPIGTIALFIGFLLEKREETVYMFYLMFITSLIAWFSWPPNTARITIVFFHSVFWLAGYGCQSLVDLLARKPILKYLSEDKWIALLLIINILFNNWLAYRWYLNPSSYTKTWGPVEGLSIPSSEMLNYQL